MESKPGRPASFPLRLRPQTRHELKGFRLSGHEKSAIVKADRDPTIFAALDYFADLTLQRYLGSPCESFSDQPDSIANLESALDPWKPPIVSPFSTSSTRRRMASIMNVGYGCCPTLLRYLIFDVTDVSLEWRQPS
jgi:hypothetical protein